MEVKPTPCPFCGARWVWRDSYHIHGENPAEGWDGFCPMLGVSLLPTTVASYNRMVANLQRLPYTVKDGIPVFGKGERMADADFVNRCIDYLKEKQE